MRENLHQQATMDTQEFLLQWGPSLASQHRYEAQRVAIMVYFGGYFSMLERKLESTTNCFLLFVGVVA
jgi:hypothetical protein